mmetsp:Transcript_11486/g.11443  ORF Transcript_11486/g.11443 Transcript_11486/m.11443 type:complete len:157 (+) Transcript_11486:181-651(+)
MAVCLMISAQISSSRKERKMLLEDKIASDVAKDYFRTYDFYWTRALYTNSLLSLGLIMTSLAATIWGCVFVASYHNNKISHSCDKSSRVALLYWHSWVFIASYSYVILIYVASTIYKTILTIFRLLCPLFTERACSRNNNRDVERYIDDFWNQDKC